MCAISTKNGIVPIHLIILILGDIGAKDLGRIYPGIKKLAVQTLYRYTDR